MTFALVVISLLIAVPFLLLVLDIGRKRSTPAIATASEVAVDGHPARRPGVIAPGEGMVHRPRR